MQVRDWSIRLSLWVGILLLVPLVGLSKAVVPSLGMDHKFYVKRIKIEGNSLVRTSTLEKAVSSYEGKRVDLGELEKAAEAVTKVYAEHGYGFARAFIPPQTLSHGVVVIYVVEGKIGKIKVVGNKFYSTRFVKWYLSGAVQKGVLSSRELERALFLLNEYPDLHVHAYLSKGREAGTTDVTVYVKDSRPIHEELGYDNFGNPYVGRNRVSLDVWDGDLTGRGDLLNLEGVYAFSKPEEAPFVDANYSIPVSSSGTTVGVSYSNADIKVGENLAILDIRGTAQIYGLEMNQPLARTSNFQSNWDAAFNYKDVDDFILGSFLTSRDRIRDIGLGYNMMYSGRDTRDYFDVHVSQGLGTLFGGMSPHNPYVSRFGATDLFTLVRAHGAHIWRVYGDDYVIFRSDAQLGFDPLPVTEEFSLGGPDSVRGYQQSEYLGDSGWDMSGEFRLPLWRRKQDIVQMAFFLDTGFSTIRYPLPGQTAKDHLTGGGFGFRAALGKSTSARIDFGFPLQPQPNPEHQSPVIYASVSHIF